LFGVDVLVPNVPERIPMTAALFFAGSEQPQFDVRMSSLHAGDLRPGHAVYVRRRLAVVLIALGLALGVAVAARAVLADRGGVPASIPAIRPANIDAASGSQAVQSPVAATPVNVAATRYIVQPGDSLWSLAQQFRGRTGMTTYVDALVRANGGAAVQPGQLILLP
jgi:nucleoid-associated protein YgaU